MEALTAKKKSKETIEFLACYPCLTNLAVEERNKITIQYKSKPMKVKEPEVSEQKSEESSDEISYRDYERQCKLVAPMYLPPVSYYPPVRFKNMKKVFKRKSKNLKYVKSKSTEPESHLRTGQEKFEAVSDVPPETESFKDMIERELSATGKEGTPFGEEDRVTEAYSKFEEPAEASEED